MRQLTISTELKKDKKVVRTCENHSYFVPENIEEAIEMDGEEKVLREYLKGRVVTFRSQVVKPKMKATGDKRMNDADIVKAVNKEADGWSPTIGRDSDPIATTKKDILKAKKKGLTKEQILALYDEAVAEAEAEGEDS